MATIDIFNLSPRDFNLQMQEEAMYRTPAELDDLRREYRNRNSMAGKLMGLLAPEEGKRRSTFLPVDAPQGMSIFDALRSGQATPAVPQGLVDLITGGTRGVESAREYAQGVPPRADALNDALAMSGLAMTGGGAVGVPRGAVGANALRGGGMSDPTETGWTFRDVKQPNLTRSENREVFEALSVPRGYEVELPIRRLFATQGNVNPDFDTTTSSQGRIPTVIRKGGEFFVRDGHHRLTKQAEAGNQNAKVFLYDLDKSNRDTPLLDYRPPRKLNQKEMAEVNGFLEELGLLGDFTAMANASKSAGLLTTAASEAQDMAKRILELRAEGRASEVTDEMMAQADPQYMFANTPLPMDEASRMARAEAAGFEGGLLHGTGADIVGVDKDKLGQKQDLLGTGFYSTTSPKRSERYVPKETDLLTQERVFSEGGNVIPLVARNTAQFDLRKPTGIQNAVKIGKAFEGSDFDVEYRGEGDQVFIKSKTDPQMSVYIDSYQDGIATLQKLKDVFGRNNVTNILEEAGFSGLKAEESFGNITNLNYEPTDVRSRFARFDPEFAHLSNLSAANVSPIGGLLAQSGVSDKQAERIEEYLRRRGLLD